MELAKRIAEFLILGALALFFIVTICSCSWRVDDSASSGRVMEGGIFKAAPCKAVEK